MLILPVPMFVGQCSVLLPMCDIPALGLLLFTVVDAAVLWPCVAVGASGLFWLWAEGPRGGSMEQLMAVFHVLLCEMGAG